MGDETIQERQDNELAALKSIYLNAVIDNRENIAWKIWRPLDFLLTLVPLHNSDIQGIHCSITLRFQCCNNYPNVPPTISIDKIHGLSKDNSTKLLAELNNMAKELCGEVMIYQLAGHAQQFLHDHNKPTLSFYEEMLKEKTEKEKLELHDKQVKENEQRQKLKDEVERRNQILRVAGRQRVHRCSISQDVEEKKLGDAPELIYYADDKSTPGKKMTRTQSVEVPCTCNAKSAQVLRISQKNNRKVYIGNCLGHSVNGSTSYLAIDDESGDRLLVKKWSIPPASDFQSRNKQHNALYRDLKVLSKIKHPSLVSYTAIETTNESSKNTMRQCIYVFRDFVIGTSLKFLRSKLCAYSDKGRFESLKLIRHVGLGVFNALKELHSVDVVHKDVRCENVFLDDFGVKLVGAGLDAILTDMTEGDSSCDRQNKAQDIYAAAQMLLSLWNEERTKHDVPTDLPSTARDFFCRCLSEDEQSQWTAEQLASHGFLVDAPANVIDSKEKNDSGSCSEDEDTVNKFQNSNMTTNGLSRLEAEFELLTYLGKGGFGDVLKVKNKLDGGFYAIKRVKLNPENVQLNKKITREVKLLSRLNHENVVRYYNAWIESSVASEREDSVENVKNPADKKRRNSLEEVVAKLGQEVKVEWSMSENAAQKRDESDSDSDTDDVDWFTSIRPDDSSSSSGVEFEEDSNNKSETMPSEVTPSPRPQSVGLKQMLYIQMEFCEKNTLRHAIDSGLYQENFRAWRLFREIVEGLAHVHQRGMIHRDLKPMNIFLDSNDHVKIGDFGLATRAYGTVPVEEKTKQNEEISESLTGQVGTAHYVAPELIQPTTKVIYNQKVDIYSLGIILFEMFHEPLNTGMERMLVLTALRSPPIRMPKDFETAENCKQIHVIRWLLNHDASLRPTCAELLSSKHVPRPVQEGALSGLLSHTLSSKGSRGYQRLLTACMQQNITAPEDLTYHSDVGRARPNVSPLKDIVVKVFKNHGAVEFSPPLLIPRAKGWDQHPNAVKVMTASGLVCHLPHDLRLPFARHTAYSGTKYMRRYVVDRVFREKHVLGFHPREITECAFDIVTPKTDSLWPDAELFVVASKAATECSLKVSIQINHTELLRTLLLSCGVPEDKHTDLYPVLVDVSFGRITSLQLQTHLTSLCIKNRDISTLLRLMSTDVTIQELCELISHTVKQSELNKLMKRPLKQLATLCDDVVALGCQVPITIAPFLAYNATQHSGIFWQMSVTDDLRREKRRAGDLVAAGGRYDALVKEFWEVARTENEKDSSELICTSVGFSMSLDRMAAILTKRDDMATVVKSVESPLICVCISGTSTQGRSGQATARLARDLWSLGYKCCLWAGGGGGGGAGGGGGGGGDAREACGAAVVLQNDAAAVTVMCWTGDRIREYRVPYIDVLDFVKQNLDLDTSRNSEGSNNRTISWSESEKSNSPLTSVTFITASERMTKNSKRLCENHINSQITNILVNLGLQSQLSRLRVHVLAIACSAACVRTLSSLITSPPCLGDLPGAFRSAYDSFPKSHKILDEAQDELMNIVKQNNQSRSHEETQLYALYSIPDSLCRLIT